MPVFLPFITRDKRTCLRFQVYTTEVAGSKSSPSIETSGESRRGGAVWETRGWSLGKDHVDRAEGKPDQFEVSCDQMNPGRTNQDGTVEEHAPKGKLDEAGRKCRTRPRATRGRFSKPIFDSFFFSFFFKCCIYTPIGCMFPSMHVFGLWLKRGSKTTIETAANTSSIT